VGSSTVATGQQDRPVEAVVEASDPAAAADWDHTVGFGGSREVDHSYPGGCSQAGHRNHHRMEVEPIGMVDRIQLVGVADDMDWRL
jgi:hypothetical protein